MQVWLERYLFKGKVIFSASMKCLRIRAQAKIKIKNRQRTLEKYRFNIEDDKKAKISCVRVPLNSHREVLFLREIYR
jgi:hypothetical protein